MQIMLRNIPNKIQQADLKKILDESSFGKYDFMYLRIGKHQGFPDTALTSLTHTLDFANNCK